MSLNRWQIFKFKRSRSKWNAKIDKEYRVQTDENQNECVSFNFVSSYYYHYCCCLNEQFFKFEIFLSISIESLLTLFAVVFIFYCQTIVVKSMFNFHQIDLSSKNLSFIYISNVSSSLIMFQQFDTWCLYSLRDFQKLCISMNITLQSFLNVSKNNIMNMKSSKRNDELNSFVTVLNSL